MVKNNSKNLSIVGRIFLLTLTVIYTWILIFSLQEGGDFSHHSNDSYIPLTYAVWLLSIGGLLFAVFLNKKYSRLIGSILIGLGFISIILMFLAPPVDESSFGFAAFIICGPVYLLMLIIGYIFLTRGNSERIKQG